MRHYTAVCRCWRICRPLTYRYCLKGTKRRPSEHSNISKCASPPQKTQKGKVNIPQSHMSCSFWDQTRSQGMRRCREVCHHCIHRCLTYKCFQMGTIWNEQL